MISTKKLSIIVLLLSVVICSEAQTFGIKAGITISTVSAKNDSTTLSDNYKPLNGFHAGLTTDIQIGDFMSIETGILFSTKGYLIREQQANQSLIKEAQPSLHLVYFDIPIVVKSWFGSDKKRTFGMLGSHIGMGLKGKFITKKINNGRTEVIKKNVEWGRNRKSDLKRLDYGIIIGVGVELNTIQISATYQYGLSNIMNISSGSLKIKNRSAQISIAYKFTNSF